MYRLKAQDWTKHMDFLLLDLLCLHLSYIVAYMIRHGLSNPYEEALYFNIIIVLSLMNLVIIIFLDSLLKNVLKRSCVDEIKMTVRHVCVLELLCTAYLFMMQWGFYYSRSVFFLTGILYAGLSLAVRLFWKWWLKNKAAARPKDSLLIVTTKALAANITREIRESDYAFFHIAGIAVLDGEVGTRVDNIEVVANRENIISYVCKEWVDEVFINLPDDEMNTEELLHELEIMGIVVHVKLLKASASAGTKRIVERLGKYTVMTVSMNTIRIGQLFLKRALDIIGGLVGCLITGILFIFVAPLIWIQSPGPILFTQIRVGKNGKPFKLYKFRSMYMDAEARKEELEAENEMADGRMFKLSWDPRIIGCEKRPDGTVKKGIGNFIRDWSIDEFPQFYNVLKGDMSLVGTRPPTVDEWEQYLPHHRSRMAIKPGITGLWQVSGRSKITDFEEVVALDKKYISEWSMMLDIKILFKTIIVVLRKEGAM